MLLQQLKKIEDIIKFYNDGESPEVKDTLGLDLICRINNTNWESMEYILCELDETLPVDILFSHKKINDDIYEITFRTKKVNDIIKGMI